MRDLRSTKGGGNIQNLRRKEGELDFGDVLEALGKAFRRSVSARGIGRVSSVVRSRGKGTRSG